MAEVSVIVPLYNADRDYLRKCMDSALSQTLKSIEVIAVNDGSTNGCEEVLKEYAGDERLKVFNQANAGTSAARNKGLDQAQGEYVIFLDADDFLESDCCERLCSFARENEDCDIIFFGYATEYTNTRVRRVLDKNIFAASDWDNLWQRDALEMAILKGDRRLGAAEIGSPWGKLIKRSAIEDGRVRYTPGLIKGQDTVFVLNL
ncbi:MAG: glycosyltransferase family 2 protein, partial [Lachnospiraceae bacterium]|nr:glycosyltransferase family 2 protein [Lachnospiraceae bacterium]